MIVLKKCGRCGVKSEKEMTLEQIKIADTGKDSR